jgi:hypothetical protein
VPWRGDRDLRDFPLALMKSSHGLWEEEKAVTLQQIYKDREQQTWNEYGWDDE